MQIVDFIENELLDILKEQKKAKKIKDFEIIINLDMTLEIQLLVEQELTNGLMDIEVLKKYENAIYITQILAEDFEEEDFGESSEKVNYHHRRRLSRLIEPETKIQEVPVITFYSYKGGLGRTTTLACFASYLAMSLNKKVIVVDCDFEAPGFSNGNYFFLDPEETKNGFVEYCMDKDFLRHFGEKPNLRKDYCYDSLNFVGNFDESLTKNDETGKGEVYVIPAGNLSDGVNYLEALSRLDLSQHLPDFLQDVTEQFELTEDNGIILFDSRTGFNDTFAALSEVSTMVVGFFGINEQNKPGIKFFAKHFNFAERNEKPHTKVIFVKALANGDTKTEQQEFKSLVSDLIGEVNFKSSFVEKADNSELKKLGTSQSSKSEFRHLLLSIQTSSNKYNLNNLFEEIINTAELNKQPEPTRNTDNAPTEEILEIKKALLNLRIPEASASAYDGNDLANDFYVRLAMHDIFKQKQFIILGSKGAGKTFLYRILDEKHSYNEKPLTRLTTVANKKTENYIFINIIDAENPFAFTKKYAKFPEENFTHFWVLHTHHAIFQHSAINALIKEYKEEYKELERISYPVEKWLNDYISRDDTKIDYVRFEDVIEQNLSNLNNFLEKNNKNLIISYDQLDRVIPIKDWERGVSPLVEYWRSSRLSRFFPKIFIRTDLWHKITANNKNELERRSVNLKWGREEMFAYFFKILLSDNENRSKFKYYVAAYYNGQPEQYEKVEKTFRTIEGEFQKMEQLVAHDETLRYLVEPCFGKTADYNEKNSPARPPSYDWFFTNLIDANDETNLRSFWKLIELSKDDENKRIGQSITLKTKQEIEFPLISPKFYTGKSNREAASRAYYDELASEEGNRGLGTFLEFVRNNRELPHRLRVYKYKNSEFDELLDLFLKHHGEDENVKSVLQLDVRPKDALKKWLENNGVIKREENNSGRYVNYMFPYFYRALFNLQGKP